MSSRRRPFDRKFDVSYRWERMGDMRARMVILTQDDESISQRTAEWVAAYEAIGAAHEDKQVLCRALIKRVKQAEAICLDGRGDIREPCLDREHLLGNEADAIFAARYFTIPQMALMQVGLLEEIAPGYYVEPAYDVLVRKGFLAELAGDYEAALQCYDGVPLPDRQLDDRMAACRRRLKRCVSHPDREAVEVCADCGRPICRDCSDSQRIYSPAEEQSLPYCRDCYERSVGFLNKHRRS